MKSGFWGNYRTGEIFQIDEHEQWVRRGENAIRLGIPVEAAARFGEFAERKDRERFLCFLFDRAPVMRFRGHGSLVCCEFSSNDWTRPLALVETWGARYAGPFLFFRVFNFRTSEMVCSLWKDFPLNRNCREKCLAASLPAEESAISGS